MGDLLRPTFPVPAVTFAPGRHLRIVKVYVYACPLCARTFRYDDPYEPLCTGPSWTDEHAPEVMRLVGTDERRQWI